MRINTQSILEQIKSPLYRNSLFLMTSTVIRAGLGFIFWMLVARFYSEAEVGWGAAIISAISLLALLSVPGFQAALIRFLPKAEKPRDMINSCLTISGIVALALSVIFIVGLDIWSPALGFIKGNAIFSLTFIFFVLILTLSPVIDSVFIAGRRAEFALFRVTIMLLLRLPLPILLALYFRAFGIAASWGIAAAVAFVISIFLFVPRVQNGYKPVPKLNLGIISNMRRYSAGSYLAHLFESTPALILPIMVLNLLGAEQNAYFYVAWMIATLLFAIPIAVSQSLFAEGAHFEDELWVNVGRSLKFTFLLLIPAIILVLLIGKWLLLLFGSSYSINGLLLLRILCISSLFIGINRIYASILRVEDKIRELVFIFSFITIGTLLGSYFIIPETGIAGIGYVWLAAQGIVSIYAILAMRSRYWAR
jgi:O-antigen/teichoic acid export membrane protein